MAFIWNKSAGLTDLHCFSDLQTGGLAIIQTLNQGPCHANVELKEMFAFTLGGSLSSTEVEVPQPWQHQDRMLNNFLDSLERAVLKAAFNLAGYGSLLVLN